MKKSHLPIKESDVRKLTRDYLRLRGYYVLYFLQGLGCLPGLSDMAAIKDGRTLWLEIKKPGKGIQSDKQKAFQDEVERHGGEYRIIRGIDDLEGL